MKKTFVIAAAAMTVFAACSKNEVAPVSDGSNAISYITVTNKPGTKAPIAGTDFSRDLAFGTYAFHLDGGTEWSTTTRETAQTYISNAEIKYYPDAVAPFKADSWHSTNAYYWPKVGNLTFFSYSFGKGNLDHAGTLTCTAKDGLKLSAYDVTAAENLNNDFMVANVEKSLSKSKTSSITANVPAEFKHALTQIRSINISTDAPCQPSGHQAGDKTISIVSVKLYGISQQGDFTYDEPDNSVDYTYTYGNWSNYSAKTSLTDGVIEFTPASTGNLPTNGSNLSFTNEQKLFIPQDLTDAKLQIVYTINSYSSPTVYATQTITADLDLKNAEGTGDASKFKANKAITYSIRIQFGADSLIYWDPTLKDWETENYTFTI